MNIKSIAFSVAFALGLSACQFAFPSSRPATKCPTTLSPSSSPLYRTTVKSTVSSSQGPLVFPKIDGYPGSLQFGRNNLIAFPKFDPNSDDPWQMDLRSYDLSKLDLRTTLDDLLYSTFDDRTIWPAADKLPAGFDCQQIMELGKNPGLNIQNLHKDGITGKNIGIAIIDQPMLVNHREYADRVRLYEEAADVKGALESEMHGPAVASIAVGKTVGVAPDADLYYIATYMCSQGSYETVDFSCLANSIRRILEINGRLPPDRKIRVLSMSIGWGPEVKGYDEIQLAVQEAKNAGIFIICTSEDEIYGFNFAGLGRSSLSDPNDFGSYEPGLFWSKYFYQENNLQNTLLVPMDSRTTASPTGNNDYVFYREGGMSWSVPYLAGMYALAAQVKPDITPDAFWSSALQTGQTIKLTHEGKEYSFGVILDPVALIHALEGTK